MLRRWVSRTRQGTLLLTSDNGEGSLVDFNWIVEGRLGVMAAPAKRKLHCAVRNSVKEYAQIIQKQTTKGESSFIDNLLIVNTRKTQRYVQSNFKNPRPFLCVIEKVFGG